MSDPNNVPLTSYKFNICPIRLDNPVVNNSDCSPLCAFTVDVEDWYQSSIDFDAPISLQVVENMELVLLLLNEFGVQATFFVQGLVAERFPQLLQRLVAEGHEVQSHGYSHRPLFKMNRRALWTELDRAHKSVEDACGIRVTAFRAPDFAIGSKNLWALEVLAEVGFEIDSSIFPIQTSRYGISGWDAAPHYICLLNGAKILEVPVALWTTRLLRIPVAGGGYFRLLPVAILEKAFHSILKTRPVIVYGHPYEFNTGELKGYYDKVPSRTLFIQGFGRGLYLNRIRHLLRHFSFGRFDQVLSNWNIL